MAEQITQAQAAANMVGQIRQDAFMIGDNLAALAAQSLIERMGEQKIAPQIAIVMARNIRIIDEMVH